MFYNVSEAAFPTGLLWLTLLVATLVVAEQTVTVQTVTVPAVVGAAKRIRTSVPRYGAIVRPAVQTAVKRPAGL